MKNHNVVSQTARNIPGFAGRRNPETPGNSDLPGLPECPECRIYPILPDKFPLFCRPNTNPIRKFAGFAGFAGPK